MAIIDLVDERRYRDAMTMHQPRIRPGRGGFVIGVLVIVAGIIAGIALMATGVISAIGKLPTFTTEISPNKQVGVEIDEAGTWGLYAAGKDATSPGGTCVVDPPVGGNVTINNQGSSLNFTRDSRQWHWLSNITVSTPGKYQFKCTGTSSIDRFALGEKPDVSGFAGRLAGGIIGLLALPCGGFTLGIVIIIVTAVRRSSARKRLRMAAYPPPYPNIQPPQYPTSGSQPPYSGWQ